MVNDPGGSVKTYWLSGGTGDLAPGIYDIGGDGQPVGDPLGTLPGAVGEYVVQNGAFFDPTGSGYGVALGPEGTSFLSVSPDGVVQVQTERAESYINQSTSLTIEYGLAGTVDITLSDGSTISQDITFAKLNRTGYRWVTYAQEGGGEALARVPADARLADLQLLNASILRWSRPGEIEAQAITGELFRLSNSQDPVDKETWRALMEAMGIDPDSPPADLSGAVESWVEMGGGNFTHAARYTFRP